MRKGREMIRTLTLACTLTAGLAGAAAAEELDLDAMDLELKGPAFVTAESVSILNIADADFGGFVVPGFFQGLDRLVVPTVELNTADGETFNLAYTPGDTGVSFVAAREGDRQLQLLFDMEGGGMVFGLFVLAEGDSLDWILTGETFDDATLTLWEVQAKAIAEIPAPGAAALLLTGLGGIAALRRRAGQAAGAASSSSSSSASGT